MAYKVAVASTDGKVINEHFGRCQKFLIFTVEDSGEFSFLELRELDQLCGSGEHSADKLEQIVEALADCRAVLVSRIGPGAERGLSSRGIEVYAVGDFIEDALVKLNQYYQKGARLTQ